MFLPTWPKLTPRKSRRASRRKPPPRPAFRPHVEALEGRCLPSTVTNLGDAGPGSLRQAILDTPAGGTVDFQEGLAGTITLTSGELLIDKDLTVAGPGADAITVSGNHASRVLDIADPALTVAISGLTIADGQMTGPADGGGIYNAGTLSVTDSVLSGNAIITPDIGIGNRGGGIYNAGTLTVTASTLDGNFATSGDGGGIYNDGGTLTVTASTLHLNSAGLGGGIYNAGTLTVTASTLSSNSASVRTLAGQGGGIYNLGTGEVTASAFSSNFASIAGAGVYNDGGTLTVTASTFSRNTTPFNGAGVVNTGTLTVTASTFSDNSARNAGGAILNNGGTLTMTNSTLSGNNVSTHGGAIYNDSGTLAVTASTLDGNFATSGDGGGIYDNGGTSHVTVRNTILAGNTAPTAPNVRGTVDSQGHNLIGDGTGGSGYDPTDQVGTADSPVDPLLGPLQDNGGPTQTMALLCGSPAIDAGDNAGAPDFDQRGEGFPRIVNGVIDIGAYEVQDGECAGPAPRGPRPAEPLAQPLAAALPRDGAAVARVLVASADVHPGAVAPRPAMEFPAGQEATHRDMTPLVRALARRDAAFAALSMEDGLMTDLR